jgi:hypothetical protein
MNEMCGHVARMGEMGKCIQNLLVHTCSKERKTNVEIPFFIYRTSF